MKNYQIQIKNKILLSTILVGVLSVSFLGGCNTGSPNTTNSPSPSATPLVSLTPTTLELITELEVLKKAISALKEAIYEKTRSNSFELPQVKPQWNAFKEKYEEYVNKLEPKNQKEIAQPILDLIQKKINKVEPIFSSQYGGINTRNQPDNSAEVVQEYLGEIEDCLGAIDKILQALESSDKFTPLNNSNEQKAPSDFQPDLTFWLVLATFLLVFVGLIVFAFKDTEERRRKRSENSQTNAGTNETQFKEMSGQFQQLILDKFVELSKIITSNKQSEPVASTLTSNQILELNNQIPAIKSSVENMQSSVNEFKSKFSSVEGSLNQFKENYSTINSTQISEQIITRLEGKIQDNAKANDLQKLGNKLEALENNLKEEFQGLKEELQKQNHVSDEHKQESVTEQDKKAETLSREKAEFEASRQELEEENKPLKDEQLNEFANQEELNKQINNLTQKLKEKEDENSKITQQLNDKLQEKDNKIEELENKRQKLGTSTTSPENRTNSYGGFTSDHTIQNPTELPQKIANPLPQKIANLVDKYNRKGIESLTPDATIKAKVSEAEETYNNRRSNSTQPLILTSAGREEYMIVSVDGGTGSDLWVFPIFTKITYSLFNATGKDLFDFNKNPSASGNSFTLKKPAKVIPYESGWKFQEKGEIDITS